MAGLTRIGDPTFKPLLRPLEAFPLPEGNGAMGGGAVALRDRSGVSEVVLGISLPALQIVALFDGTHSCREICERFHAQYGQRLPADSLTSLLEQLEQAHFLDGPAFEAYYHARQAEYRAAGARPMRDPLTLGIADHPAELFERILASADRIPLAKEAVGIIAPHLDYARGEPCYAAAYATLRERKPPQCVVVLGTNHFGRSTSPVATACDFATPLGVAPTDVDFIGELESRCGDLRTCELDHAREHSIELQVAWLQHLYGAESFMIVPILCPDPCGPESPAPLDQTSPAAGRPDVDLRVFAETLGDLIQQDARDVLVVAGADLSHVGRAFGDDRTLDDAFLDEVRRRDMAALSKLEINDPTGFVGCVANEGNPSRVCSAGCTFVAAVALRRASATILRYHQAVDRPSQTCVTCAAAVFTRRSDSLGNRRVALRDAGAKRLE